MNIKVAYDITFLGTLSTEKEVKVGIFRTAEQLMKDIIKSKDIDLNLVGICENSPAYTYICCSYYLKRYLKQSYQLSSSYYSQAKLERIYQNLFDIYFSRAFQKLPKFHPTSVLIRGILKILEQSRLLTKDTKFIFNPKDYDLFHSTYCQLPSPEILGDLPSLLMIYDLIPVKATQFVNPTLTNYFKTILNSINFKKDWITCISDYTRQELCEYTKISPHRTFVTHLAADDRFYPILDTEIISIIHQRFHIPEGNYFLCLASQLEPRKNLPHLIRSFVHLITEHSHLDINLVLIGSQKHKRSEITNLMEELKEYKDKIIFTGYVPDEDLSALYSGATSFIFPSLYEGFGLPILEAMQCGTPVICSNTTSLPEVAGDAAILVNPKDQDELCQAMLNILTDSDLRQKLKNKGLEQAKKFSWKKCAQETVEIYKTIISSK